MKNRMNQRSSAIHIQNVRAFYFTDQPCAEEVARLFISPSASAKTVQKKGCPMWQPVIGESEYKKKLHS